MKSVAPVIALLSLALLTGCENGTPQFSGTYRLVEQSADPTSFAGEKRLPGTLVVDHRMDYTSTFLHEISLDFQGVTPDEIHDNFVIPLKPRENSEHPSESGMHAEPKYVGADVDCSLEITHTLAVETVPSFRLLNSTYNNVKETVGVDEVTGFEHEVHIQKLEEATLIEEALRRWDDALAANNGKITLMLRFKRNVDGHLGWVDNGIDCWLPDDGRRDAELRAVYESVDHDESLDLRQHSMDELPEQSRFKFQILNDLVTGMKI